MKPRQTSPMLDACLRRRFLAFLAILSLATLVIDFRSNMEKTMKLRPSPARFALPFFLLLLLITGGLNTAGAQQVQVTAADPASTAQGTINLNVKVTGKGFKNGAKAKWFVTGTTDPGGVTVNSTTFVSSIEVTANITVSDTAVISNFDIQVLNADGRGGKGTELFRVTAKGQTACPAMQPAPTSDTKCYLGMAGCLDSTFDGIGYVHINTNANQSLDTQATGVVVQPDGKVVVAGYAYVASGDADFALIRYNVDGSLDTSFGDVDPFNSTLRRGFTITKITTASDMPRTPLLQPDGKIILGGASGVGSSSRSTAVVKYNSNGSLDPSFGTGGIAVLNFGRRVTVPDNEFALQSDGKILIAGGSGVSFAVARLLPNGSPDTGFGSGGLALANPSTKNNGYGWGSSLAIQRSATGEERIVVAGLTDNWDWTVIRLRSNGALDTSFGNNGNVKTAFNGFRAVPARIRVDSNNRPTVAGYTYNASTDCGAYATDFAIARYTQDGNLDGSFGGGRQTVDIYGGSNSASDLTIQTDDKIVVVGSANSSDGSVGHIGLVRFNGDGTRDTSFGLSGNGTVTTELYGSKSWGCGVAIDPSTGKVVVVSRTFLAPDFNDAEIAVVRYLP